MKGYKHLRKHSLFKIQVFGLIKFSRVKSVKNLVINTSQDCGMFSYP